MGVHGLWKLLEASGKPVPLESLDNKVLAVDVSIWLHQLVKGFQDTRGAPLPNAHLLGLFHRVCKLLFYRIKPVFVFDGGVPLLKRQTIAARKKLKTQASQDAAHIREQLLKNLIKRKAVRRVLQGKEGKENPDASKVQPRQEVPDIFQLPPTSGQQCENSDSESEGRSLAIHQPLVYSSDSESESAPEPKISPHKLLGLKLDLHSLDVNSEEFLSLPPDVRHDILSELQETRKQNSWGRLHEMPEESNDFSSFQLGRLIKRRNVQVSLEQAEKEMGGKVLSLNELQDLMSAQGVNIVSDETSTFFDSSSKKIASDAATRYLLLKDPSTKGNISAIQKSSEPDLVKGALHENVAFCPNNLENVSSLYNDTWSSDEEIIADHVNDILANAMESGEDLSQEQILALIQSSSESQTFKNSICDIKGAHKIISIQKPEIATKAEPSTSILSFEKLNPTNTNHYETDQFHDEILGNEAQESKEETHTLKGVQSTNEDKGSIKSRAFGDNRHDKISLNKSTAAVRQPDSAHTFEVDASGKSLFSYENSTQENEIIVNNEHSNQVSVCDKMSDSSIDEEAHAESDSDEFQEVSGKSIDLTNTETNTHDVEGRCEIDSGLKMFSKPSENETKDQKAIEIIINPKDNPLDDDIFADIFSTSVPASREVKNGDILAMKLSKVEKESTLYNSLDSESSSFQDSTSNIFKNVTVDISDCFQLKSNDSPGQNDETITYSTDIVSPKSEDSACVITEPSMCVGKDELLEHAENINAHLKQGLSSLELHQLEDSLQAEENVLQTEKGRQERLAASITEQMCLEAQELLQLFGLPYIVAPLEAEAQCAFLDSISLTEGTITDDSDIWLFGGKKVYKNFFNQKKHVLQYTYSNIQHYFKLTREQLVQLALLVGSDYTVGLQGIGPVTGLEIISAFSSNSKTGSLDSSISALKQFKNWYKAGCPHHSPQKQQLGKKLKNVQIIDGFPNPAVVEAYLRPTVDDSRETFSWGALDLPALRDYAKSKFGWPASKTDEILLPVSKRWSLRTSQRSIDSYFNLQPNMVEGISKMSKRVQKAVQSMSTQNKGDNSDNADSVEAIKACTEDSSKSKPFQLSKGSSLKGRKRGRDASSLQEDKDSYKEKILPVRAPTVPRIRTSKGIKRVGVHTIKGRSSTLSGKCEDEKSDNTASAEEVDKIKLHSSDGEKSRKRKLLQPVQKRRVVKRPNSQSKGEDCDGEKFSDGPPTGASSFLPDRNSQEGIVEKTNFNTKKVVLQVDEGEANKSSNMPYPSISSESEDEVLPSKKYIQEIQISQRSLDKYGVSLHSDNYDTLPIASTSGINSKPRPTGQSSFRRRANQDSLPGSRLADKEISDSCSDSESGPHYSTSASSLLSDNIGSQDCTAVEAEEVSAIDWEEDPWECRALSTHSKSPRQKLYFGGIRPNKPVKRNAKSLPQHSTPPTSGSDSRGMRPGWRTEQHIQSRDTAWIEAVQAKKEVIPQREHDRQTLEQAKMKAIKLMKASDSVQASRILGVATKNAKRGRGRGKVKPTRKELPEHNLSESSSDE